MDINTIIEITELTKEEIEKLQFIFNIKRKTHLKYIFYKYILNESLIIQFAILYIFYLVKLQKKIRDC